MVKVPERYRIIVVGLHRARLSRVMALVEEMSPALYSSTSDIISPSENVSVSCLPCIASMSSYKAEDGSQVRYMASFAYHDGSVMTKFFDDPGVRDSLVAVCMIGYEWDESKDKPQLENYFRANNLNLPVECIHANEPFHGSLKQEMHFFKHLTDEEKSNHVAHQTMGPGKMAKFILDTANRIKEEKLKEIEEKEGTASVQETSSLSKQQQGEDNVAVKDDTKGVQSPTLSEPEINEAVVRQFPDQSKSRFACRMCRTVLFGEDDLAANHVKNLHSFRKANYNAMRQTTTAACQSIFCTEIVLEWLAPDGQHTEGRLECTKCRQKIGHWRWAGAQCSCGTWVTPAIQITASKVDTLEPSSCMSQHREIRGVTVKPVFPTSTIR